MKVMVVASGCMGEAENVKVVVELYKAEAEVERVLYKEAEMGE